MILTVTLNPALDLTYAVPELRPHASHRVASVVERAGGKGLNTARVLARLGERTVAAGLLGGRTGERVAELLDVPHAFTPIVGETRRTVVVADPDATGFWEPGPRVGGGEWAAFLDRYRALLRVSRVVVLSGSAPRGLPEDAYAVLVGLAREAGTATVLDTSGPGLAAALAAGPAVVKPNAEELAEAAPASDTATVAGVLAAAATLRAAGAGAVVASRGPEGIVALTPEGAFRAAPPGPVAGNPTGAGDACVAALARALRHGSPWPAALREAVAASAAAVLAPTAGDIDVREYLRLRHGVTVDRIEEHTPCH